MLKHLEGARLGLFIFFGTTLLIIAIFMIGNRDSLFVRSITIQTYFSKIEGLRTGAPVRLSGYDIGSVSNLSLTSDTTGRVLVTMRIEDDIRHFIRLDSKASISTEGLVGKKIVSISPGSSNEAIVSDGGFIKSNDPVNVDKIIKEVQEIMAYMKDITKEFSGISAKINSGQGSIGKLINDEQLYFAAVDITKSADKNLTTLTEKMEEASKFIIALGDGFDSILSNIDSTIYDVKGMISDVKSGKGILGKMLTEETVYDSVKVIVNNLVKTTEGTSLAAKDLQKIWKH